MSKIRTTRAVSDQIEPHSPPPKPSPIKGEGLCQRGGPVSAPSFVLPPPRWGWVRVGVMRAECTTRSKTALSRRVALAAGDIFCVKPGGGHGGSGDALEDGVEEFGAALAAGGIVKHRLPIVAEDQVGAERREPVLHRRGSTRGLRATDRLCGIAARYRCPLKCAQKHLNHAVKGTG